jgi:hypothetical protein
MADKKYTPREAAIQVLQKAEELYRASSLSKAEIPLEKAKMDESMSIGDKARARTQRNNRTETTTTPPSLMGKLMGKKPTTETESTSAKYHQGPNRGLHMNTVGGHGTGAGAGKKVVGTPAATQHKTFVPSGKDRLAHKLTQVGKSEDQANPDASADAKLGEKVEQDVQAHEAQNQDSAHHEKGSYKLAKFMGRREHKRGQQGKEMDKGENSAQMSGKTGTLASKETGHEQGVNVKGNRGASHGISEAGAAVRDIPHSSPKQAAANMAGAKESHQQTLNQIHQMSKPKLPV